MPKAISEEEVRNLFQLWNGALATLDPNAVVRRYAENAVLLPTVLDIPCTDYGLIKDYFVGYLTKKPQGKILESNVTIEHKWCQDAGIHEFTMGSTGDKVKGWYSFVFVYQDGEWKIAQHHWSVMWEAFLWPAPKSVVKNVLVDKPISCVQPVLAWSWSRHHESIVPTLELLVLIFSTLFSRRFYFIFTISNIMLSLH